MNSTKRKNTWKSFLAFVIVLGITLMFSGLSIWVVGFDYMKNHSVIEFFAIYMLVIGIILIMIYLHVIIHEAGHCVMGLISGYKFLSYRIGIFTWIKYEDKIQVKKYSIPGTAGQCIMIPPEYNDGQYPYKRYFFGGILGNLVLSMICIVLIFLNGIDTYVGKLLVICTLIGVYDVLINGIPMLVSGVPNDGKNILLMTKNIEERKNIWEIFSMLAEHYKGTPVTELPRTWERYTEEDFINHVHETGYVTQAGLKLSELLVQKKFEEAEVFLDKILENENMPEILRNEFLCERIYVEVLLHGREEILEKIYDNKLKTYVNNAKKAMISKRRMLFAYELLYRNDKEKAQKEKEFFYKMCRNYPNKGEIVEEKILLEEVEKKYD